MEIEWRKIDGWDGYEVSRCGLVRSFNDRRNPNGLIMKQHKKQRRNGQGRSTYWVVGLKCSDKKKKLVVHRLVCSAFNKNYQNKPQVNHIDGNSLNNHANNLEWCTAKENTEHAWKIGLCGVNRKWHVSEENIKYIVENYVNLGSKLLSDQLKIPASVIREYGKKYGADLSKSKNKKVIDINTKIIYNTVDEVSKLSGYSIRNLRRWMNNERRNPTNFRYIDNSGNITEAKIFEEKPKYIPSEPQKRIAVFDLKWNELVTYEYLSGACKFVDCDRKDIYRFLSGKCGQVKGHKFKLIDENWKYIEPTPFISKRKPKKIKIKGEVSPCKKVEMYNLDGILLCTHQSIGEAARSTGSNKKQFARQIKKSPTGYSKGFNWKIID